MDREANVLPFRSTPEHEVLVSDRSETQLRADHRWALVSWGIWGVVCATIAVLQLLG